MWDKMSSGISPLLSALRHSRLDRESSTQKSSLFPLFQRGTNVRFKMMIEEVK